MFQRPRRRLHHQCFDFLFGRQFQIPKMLVYYHMQHDKKLVRNGKYLTYLLEKMPIIIPYHKKQLVIHDKI